MDSNGYQPVLSAYPIGPQSPPQQFPPPVDPQQYPTPGGYNPQQSQHNVPPSVQNATQYSVPPSVQNTTQYNTLPPPSYDEALSSTAQTDKTFYQQPPLNGAVYPPPQPLMVSSQPQGGTVTVSRLATSEVQPVVVSRLPSGNNQSCPTILKYVASAILLAFFVAILWKTF